MAGILIIEDNPAHLALVSLFPRKADHTRLSTGETETNLSLERLEAFELMDIQLPGMDGLATTALLKPLVNKGIPSTASATKLLGWTP